MVRMCKISKGRPLLVVSLFMFFLTSCLDQHFVNNVDSEVEVKFNIVTENTKTSINGLSLSWSDGDKIGVFFEDAQSNLDFKYSGDNSFSGTFYRKYFEPSEREVYAYYPYRYNQNSLPDSVIGKLQPYQIAPFDSKNDYIVADVSTIMYDEAKMPDHSLTFGHHLFSILKVVVSNSESQYEAQSIYNIHIESKTRILSGTFAFDATKGKNAEANFNTSEGDTLKHIDVYFSGKETVGKGQEHIVYVVIPSGQYEAGDLSVTINTDSYESTVTTKKNLNLEVGTLYELEPIDFSRNIVPASDKKKVFCFGDSITTGVMTEQLQSLLGIDWKVYIAGVPFEKVLQIMARQGTVPVYLKGGFTIPASKDSKVDVGSSFFTPCNTDGTEESYPKNAINFELGYYNGNTQYCGLTNPFSVCGVECEITSSSGKLKLRRLSDGESVDCTSEEYVLALPCAAWKYGIPTVTTVYMGTNGAYSTNAILAYFYNRIKQNVSPNGFIAVGYHNFLYSESYKMTMQDTLGSNFLDLREKACGEDGERVMKDLGLYFTLEDYINISKGQWPASWDSDGMHPNQTGAKAYAYFVYYKMRELGYVE